MNLKLRDFSWEFDYSHIQLSEDSWYYQLRQVLRIFQQNLYLRPLTHYSVSAQTFHYSVVPSQFMQVQEY